MTNKELSYQIYSEFKNSNWYVYWDKDYAHIKKYQLLVVWYIKEENFTYYDYVTLKSLLENNKPQNGLSYVGSLTENEIKEFISFCEEFCEDVEAQFGTED